MIPVYSLLLVCVLPIQVHTRPRVQRAPGIPHALQGGERFINGSGASRREREGVCGLDVIASAATQTPSFRDAPSGADPESRDSPMRNCASEVWSCGPSRNDSYGFTRSLKVGSRTCTGGGALPLPLAGEGWGGGASAKRDLRVDSPFPHPPRSGAQLRCRARRPSGQARGQALPRKRER